MSYYQRGQYGQQQPPPPPPPTGPQGYYDQYGQYQQPATAQGQHDGAQYAGYPGQPQYSPQMGYDQYRGSEGGPVRPQYQDGGYATASPRQASFGAVYQQRPPPPPQQQQQQLQQPYSYNPQHYAPGQTQAQAPIALYNPTAYAAQDQHGQQYAGYGSYSPRQYQPSPPQPSPGHFSNHVQYGHSPPPPQHSQGYAQPSYPQRSATEQYPLYQSQSPYAPETSLRPTQSVNYHSSYHQSPPTVPETWVPSPPIYANPHAAPDPRQSPSPLYPNQSHSSLPSPPSSSTPGPTPPAHGTVSRNPSDRHPQSRPLPGRPDLDSDDYFPHSNGLMSQADAERLSQEELFSQVEDALNATAGQRGHSPSISISHPPREAASQASPLFNNGPTSPGLGQRVGVGRHGSVTQNGNLSPLPPVEPHYHYSSDSDAEATQGLAMLQEAEANDWRGSGSRFTSYGSLSGAHSRNTFEHQQQPARHGGEDEEDYGAIDYSSYLGPDVRMSQHTADPRQLVSRWPTEEPPLSMPLSPQDPGYNPSANGYAATLSAHSSLRRSHPSQSSRRSDCDDDYGMTGTIHPFPPFNPAARVEVGGTGGLSEPSALGRRQSYDEGDEEALMDAGGPGIPERFPDEPMEIFFQQAGTRFESSGLGSLSARPLPAVPAHEGMRVDTQQLQQQSPGGGAWGPDAYVTNAQGQLVPRSSSMISHATVPSVPQPLRSKTDAEERRLRALRSSTYAPSNFDAATPASSVVPDLPSLGAKRFVPGKLGAPDYKKCTEPWSMNALLKWLFAVVGTGAENELKESEIKEALVALFTNKVPTMNIADAEGLSHHVVTEMFKGGVLVTNEEWVRLVPGPLSGVVYQLTGAGCYAPTLHDHVLPGRCYSHLCQRTLKKVNLANLGAKEAQRGDPDWASFYHLKKEDVEGRQPKELERQNQLHEIVYTEVDYVEQMSVLRTLYRDALAREHSKILNPKRKERFLKEVFGRVDAVKAANEEHLLPQLKYRQQEQGPWIVGFSDIFRQWIRKAKAAYLEYAGGFPGANFLFRQEIERNLEFRAFIDRASKDKRSARLQWDHFLKAPITRLQRYSLLLSTVLRNMKPELEGLAYLEQEKRNLAIAVEEIKAVTLECDARLAEMQRQVDLRDLTVKLVLRPGMQAQVELNLDHIGRQLIHRGDLQRMGGNRFTWLESHAVLFDHYLVIAKTVTHRSDAGGKVEKYDVSRLPIPMDLLILESTNEPPVQKSNYVKGITSVTTVAPGRPGADSGMLELQHVNTGASTNTLQTVTSLGEGKDSDRIMHPFKIKHLGRETYTLFAPSESARREWCTKIIEAKTKHAAALYAQNAEPFRLRVMADSAFSLDAYSGSGKGSQQVIKGTPVDRAIKEVEMRFHATGRPGPICRARVNCATGFWVLGTDGVRREMVAVGTDFGVYVCEGGNPRGWVKSIPMTKVTQIAVLGDFNLFLLIADKSLIAYHLDVVCPSDRTAAPAQADSARRAPQKLSGSRDVGLFAVGRQKDRTLVFYKKRENLNSVFKVLEPIYQKSTEKKRGAASLLRRGSYEFFREFDEFYIPAECTGMDLFHSSLAVSTARGFEVLTLDKKQPWSVPDLRPAEVQNIAQHIKDQRALAMLRLSDQEFLLCYSQCAVYVNKHGEVSRSVIMDFVGNASSAALYGAYLVLFDNDFVEIRNAQNGRLKQIIAGREIKCLDDGGPGMLGGGGAGANGYAGNGTAGSGSGGRTVKFVMQMPDSKVQMVLELLLNENMKE